MGKVEPLIYPWTRFLRSQGETVCLSETTRIKGALRSEKISRQ